MSLIVDPHSWLKMAVIITCTAAVLSQALVMPVQAIEQHLQAPAAAVLQIKDAGPLNAFKSKSLSGDEAVYLSADNPAVTAVDPTLSATPAASFMQNTAGEVVCAVSENPGMAANLGSRIIQIDSTVHGAIVESGLTRLASSAHEYGHCLDILVRKDISPILQASGLTPYTVPGVLINQAMVSDTGTLDFNWLLRQSPQEFQVAAEAGRQHQQVFRSSSEDGGDRYQPIALIVAVRALRHAYQLFVASPGAHLSRFVRQGRASRSVTGSKATEELKACILARMYIPQLYAQPRQYMNAVSSWISRGPQPTHHKSGKRRQKLSSGVQELHKACRIRPHSGVAAHKQCQAEFDQRRQQIPPAFGRHHQCADRRSLVQRASGLCAVCASMRRSTLPGFRSG